MSILGGKMTIDELKGAYNVLIAREKKAEKFLGDNSFTIEKRDSWIPEFNNITVLLSTLMNKYKEITGEDMKDDNILNGFQ